MLTGPPGELPNVPPLRRVGGHVLYLDFDGVLHPHNVYAKRDSGPFLVGYPGHELFEHCALLEEVLEPYPELRIVLSTSWVRHYRSVSHVARRLTHGLKARVVGGTFTGAWMFRRLCTRREACKSGATCCAASRKRGLH
ncbi:HAD domain-containing protein [Paraburkholderia denitrificans]|uniref:HAD domain-containing protein n=1 Tax=Paraburkholderia denitrificans TaxID=694025 RepID=A0ABW0JDW0_9BURK